MKKINFDTPQERGLYYIVFFICLIGSLVFVKGGINVKSDFLSFLLTLFFTAVSTIVVFVPSQMIMKFYLNIKKRKNDEVEKELQLQKIRQVTKKHLQTLSRKRNQLIIYDDYGNENLKGWGKELEYFINNTIKELPGTGLHLEASEICEMIDDMVIEYQEDKEEEEELDDNMSGLEYEHYCAALLRKYGWQASVTKGSGDQGVDIIAEKGNVKYAIQCKMYGLPVGNKAVQEVHAGKNFIGATRAAVITNSTYTVSAKQLANSLDVILLHHEEIDKL